MPCTTVSISRRPASSSCLRVASLTYPRCLPIFSISCLASRLSRGLPGMAKVWNELQ